MSPTEQSGIISARPRADSAFPFAQLQSIGSVWAFLDLEHPAIAWAVMRGMLVSASHVSEVPGFISFMHAGIIRYGSNSRLFNESIIELWRLSHFKDRASRMRGMYFFGSRADAEARIGDDKWPPYFMQNNLIEFELLCDEMPTIVDANWITFAKTDQQGRLPTDDLNWISSYWIGAAYNESPVWEVIANGVALVLDEPVRRQCNAYLEELFPRSHIPILMARLASEAGTRGGLIHPFLLCKDQRTVTLAYLWSDAEFHESEVIQAISLHPDSSKLGNMMIENETWNAPDFRPWGSVFSLGTEPIPNLGGHNAVSVHNL